MTTNKLASRFAEARVESALFGACYPNAISSGVNHFSAAMVDGEAADPAGMLERTSPPLC